MGNFVSWLTTDHGSPSEGPSRQGHLLVQPGEGDITMADAEEPKPVSSSPDTVPIVEGSLVHSQTVSSVQVEPAGQLNVAGRDLNIVVNNFSDTRQASLKLSETQLSDILSWWSKINFRAILADNLSRRAAGTGLKMLKTIRFQHWLITKGAIIWGTGMPGAGKTVLASIVVEHLQELAAADGANICVCFAYCRYTEQLSVRAILAALVRQILERNSHLHSILLGARYTRHRRENTLPDQKELVEVLVQISRQFKMAFFVLDGLDEAFDDVKFDLLAIFAALELNFFITSRPLRFLESSLPSADHFEVVAEEQDLNLFIFEKINGNPRLKGLVDHLGLRDAIASAVRSRSAGMFLHASLQMGQLQHCLTAKDISHVLESPPESLNDMYASTMRRICGAPHPHVKSAIQILLLVVYAVRSLNIEELQHAMATCTETNHVRTNDIIPEESLTTLCHGLITVERPNKNIRLIHYTAKEALHPILLSLCSDPHQRILSLCIAQLLASGIVQHEATEMDVQFGSLSRFARGGQLRSAFQTNHFLRYSYDNWAFHARECLPGNSTANILDFILTCTSYPIWQRASVDFLSPIHVAALHAFPDVVTSLVAKGHDFNATSAVFKWTPLTLACLGDHHIIVELLLGYSGIAVNSCNIHGQTALILSSKMGFSKVVEILLAHTEIQVDACDNAGFNALASAALHGRVKIIRLLLAHSNPIASIINASDHEGFTPLMHAAMAGQDCAVKALLSYDQTLLNVWNSKGSTALMLACAQGHLAVVEALIDCDRLDVTLSNSKGWNALRAAHAHGHKNIVDRIFQMHASKDPESAAIAMKIPDAAANSVDENGDTSLLSATKRGHVNTVRDLLKLPGIMINLGDANKWTPLMTALRLSRLEGFAIAEMLLDTPGIQPNAKDSVGETALTYAIKHNHFIPVWNLLRAPGIDVNMDDRDGSTPLILAARKGLLDVVDDLLSLHSDTIAVNSVNREGLTALAYANRGGHVNVVQRLLQFPGINVPNL